jgi:hypothetical protein
MHDFHSKEPIFCEGLDILELTTDFKKSTHRYSLSSERLVDIKITKFYAEKVLPSVNYLFIYLQQVTCFALKLCSN